MRPGDLCRFKDGLSGSTVVERCAGLTFMVLDVFTYSDGGRSINILIDGLTDPGWGGKWIEDNSEVLSEAG